MNTKAIRLYGVDDIRLEEFSLPEITEDEISFAFFMESILISCNFNEGFHYEVTEVCACAAVSTSGNFH